MSTKSPSVHDFRWMSEASAQDPKLKSVQLAAIDVRPYRWGILCEFEGRQEPFVNQIVSRRWADDGKRICFMFDSHNFLFADPHDLLDVIPMPEAYSRLSEDLRNRIDERDERYMKRKGAS